MVQSTPIKLQVETKQLTPTLKDVTWIDVDELIIDPCNVRRGQWEHDKEDDELIRDIEERGVETPLLVRPYEIKGVLKYGIVQGSRRFNAAIFVGLVDIPCIVRDMTDTEAKIESLRENRLRKEAPKWMEIEHIGEIVEGLGESGSIEWRAEQISKNTGLAKSTILKYWKIYGLPSSVKELLRKPEDRSRWLKERMLLLRRRQTSKKLSISNAHLIAKCLQGFNETDLLRFAVFLIGKPHEKAEKLIYLIKKRPNVHLDILYDEILTGTSKIARIIYFDRATIDSLDRACLDRQSHYHQLIIDIITDWLKTNNYIVAKTAS